MNNERCQYYCTGRSCFRGSNCRYEHDDYERSRYLRQQEQDQINDVRNITRQFSDQGSVGELIKCSRCPRMIDTDNDCWSNDLNTGQIMCDFHCGFCGENFDYSLGGNMAIVKEIVIIMENLYAKDDK